jgi:YYY domain-containing protein
MIEVLQWLLVVELIGLAALPVSALLFPRWPDRGFFAAKVLGLLVVGYLTWVLSMLGMFGFTGPTIVMTALLLGGLSWGAFGGRVRSAWPTARRVVLGEEAVFLAVFGVAVVIRAFNASIAGQEKPMDFTFLNSLIVSGGLPVEDPWMAGYALPYYYFGYFLNALPAKASAITPSVAYNLAVATTLALGGLGAFGLTFALARLRGAQSAAASLWGLGGMSALCLVGNLDGAVEILASHGIGDAGFWGAFAIKTIPAAGTANGLLPSDGAWWFHSARVVAQPYIEPDGITEFPFFSFLLGDLHPHFMALPLAGFLISLAVSHLFRDQASDEEPAPVVGAKTIAQAIALGAVIPTNTWDVPMLWGLFAIGSLAGGLRLDVPLVQVARQHGLRLLSLFVAAVVLYFPYFIGYTAQPLGLGVVVERTPIGALFILFGLLLVLPVVAALVSLIGDWPDLTTGERSGGAGAVVVGLVLSGAGQPTVGLLTGLLVVWAVLFWHRLAHSGGSAAAATALLAFAGIGVVLVPELVFLRDVFGTRMNTVFKFYYDGWILLALAAPLLGLELLRAIRAERGPSLDTPVGRGPRMGNISQVARGLAASGLAVAGVIYVAGAVYAPAATYTKSDLRGGATLDGMAQFRTAHPDEAAAIDWLRQNQPRARVLEAVGDDYSEAARFATFTPAVGVMGWVGHELQWRGPIAELEQRRALVGQFYADPQNPDARRSLAGWRIDLVVAGNLERQKYGADVEQRLDGALSAVYRTPSTTIYRFSGVGGA